MPIANAEQIKRILILITPTLRIGRDCWDGINRYIREHQPAWALASHPAWRFADVRQPLALRHPVDGAIVWSFLPMPDDGWRTPDTRVVAVINYELAQTTPTVVADDIAKGRAAAQHLLEENISSFMYLGRPGRLSRLRQQGFVEAIAEAGMPAPEIFDFGESVSPSQFAQFLKERISDDRPAIGVLAYNDSLGAHVLDICRDSGIDVPRSVAVVGIDNDELICESSRPHLSSVQAPFEQVGYTAAKLLAEMLASSATPSDRVTLIEGGCFVAKRPSSTPVETADLLIQRALGIINSRFRDNIGVADLYARQGVSRRSFEYRFRQAVGCSPYEKILRVRVEHAKALLHNTHLNLNAIAFQSGFNSEPRLNENFRRQTGMTPGDFRVKRGRSQASISHPRPA